MTTTSFFVLRTFNKNRSYGGPEEVFHYDSIDKLLQEVDYLRENAPEKKILGAYKRTITQKDEVINLD